MRRAKADGVSSVPSIRWRRDYVVMDQGRQDEIQAFICGSLGPSRENFSSLACMNVGASILLLDEMKLMIWTVEERNEYMKLKREEKKKRKRREGQVMEMRTVGPEACF